MVSRSLQWSTEIRLTCIDTLLFIINIIVILSIHCIQVITKVLKERAIDVRMAGARTDKLWGEAPQSLNLILRSLRSLF
jgi:hypothetical protein